MKRGFLLLLCTLSVACDGLSERLRRSLQKPNEQRQSDARRNADFRKLYEAQLDQQQRKLKQDEEHMAIEAEKWKEYAATAVRDEAREQEEDARAARYEALLERWEEQADRLDAILDEWEMIRMP